jgi:hypothetical protein
MGENWIHDLVVVLCVSAYAFRGVLTGNDRMYRHPLITSPPGHSSDDLHADGAPTFENLTACPLLHLHPYSDKHP